MTILLLVVLFVPGLILLALGSAGAGADRPHEQRPGRVKAESGELPELLRRPLRPRAQ
jgi:hypothetical protein